MGRHVGDMYGVILAEKRNESDGGRLEKSRQI